MIESLHEIGKRINKFLLDCDYIEDVFGSDEEIEAAAKFLRRSGLVSQQSLDQKRVPFLAGEDVVDVEQQHDSIMDDLDFFFVRM